MTFGRAIEIVEVGPRDGLQNEAVLVSTADKLALIARAIGWGVRRIEVASFVNPRKVPQMADAEMVAAALPEREDVTYIGLVLNRRGAERALATPINQLGAVAISTDGFAMRNQGQSSAESVEEACAIAAMARAKGRTSQATIGAAFGCPFEGEVAADRILAMACRLADAGMVEVALADTIGVAVPQEVSSLVANVRRAIDPVPVRVHFHNTRNTGIANVWAAIDAGASRGRFVDRWARRLPVCARSGGKRGYGGCGLPARTLRNCHRAGHEGGYRIVALAIRNFGQAAARHGEPRAGLS